MAPPRRGGRDAVAPATPRAPIGATLRRLRPYAIAAAAAVVLYVVVGVVVSLYTNWLWFDSVHGASVYRRRLLTQLGMFAVFAGAAALAVVVNLTALQHHSPYD